MSNSKDVDLFCQRLVLKGLITEAIGCMKLNGNMIDTDEEDVNKFLETMAHLLGAVVYDNSGVEVHLNDLTEKIGSLIEGQKNDFIIDKYKTLDNNQLLQRKKSNNSQISWQGMDFIAFLYGRDGLCSYFTSFSEFGGFKDWWNVIVNVYSYRFDRKAKTLFFDLKIGKYVLIYTPKNDFDQIDLNHHRSSNSFMTLFVDPFELGYLQVDEDIPIKNINGEPIRQLAFESQWSIQKMDKVVMPFSKKEVNGGDKLDIEFARILFDYLYVKMVAFLRNYGNTRLFDLRLKNLETENFSRCEFKVHELDDTSFSRWRPSFSISQEDGNISISNMLKVANIFRKAGRMVNILCNVDKVIGVRKSTQFQRNIKDDGFYINAYNVEPHRDLDGTERYDEFKIDVSSGFCTERNIQRLYEYIEDLSMSFDIERRIGIYEREIEGCKAAMTSSNEEYFRKRIELVEGNIETYNGILRDYEAIKQEFLPKLEELLERKNQFDDSFSRGGK